MVPEADLAAVYRILASAHESRAGRPGGQLADLQAAAGGGWLDPGFVRTHLASRSETIRGLTKYLADRPGEAVTADAAAQTLNLRFGWNSLAGALGAFGNYLANRGIEFPWATTTDPRDDRVRLMMDEDTAAAIKRAL